MTCAVTCFSCLAVGVPILESKASDLKSNFLFPRSFNDFKFSPLSFVFARLSFSVYEVWLLTGFV